MEDRRQIELALQDAWQRCTERGLHQSGTWAAEQLNGLYEADGLNANTLLVSPSRQHAQDWKFTPLSESQLSNQEHNLYTLAYSYFSTKQYQRAHSMLQNARHPKLRFLGAYAKYLHGEKRRMEQMHVGGAGEGATAINEELAELEKSLAKDCEASSDPFLFYLYALVLARLNKPEQALQYLIISIKNYPYIWGAWEELGSILKDETRWQSVVQELEPAVPRFMFYFFLYHVWVTHYFSLTTVSPNAILASLFAHFPSSTRLRLLGALGNYHNRDFDEAETAFINMQHKDPFSLDGMDVYSNILFAQQNREGLSKLAKVATEIDKYRPETCCVLGNYYSLMHDHAKAITYFRRALQLDKTFISAWILMGHDYLELKNSQGAIHAYRKAVELNPRDYRALYGLGQAYEFLRMFNYAIWYYGKACSLRPNDARLWNGLGAAYMQVGRRSESIKCFQRAVSGNDEGSSLALCQLAKLYAMENKMEAAVVYWKLALQMPSNTAHVDHYFKHQTEAAVELANYLREQGRLAEIEKYGDILEKTDEGGAIMREIRSSIAVRNLGMV